MPFTRRYQTRSHSRVSLLSLAAATAAALLARHPAAADGNVATYIDTAGNWADPGVWDTFAPPGDGDFAYIFGSGTGAAVLTFNDQSGTTGNLALVNIDSPGPSVLLKQTGSIFAADQEFVGYSGAGSLSVTGGTHSVGTGPNGAGSLWIGYITGSSGTVTLGSGARISVGGTTYVGSGGSGTFNQTGGDHSAGGLVVGSSGPGTYTMSGDDATLYVSGAETIGDAASGFFSQLGGAHFASNLTLGGSSTSGNGSYSLAGATASLTVYGTETVGGSGVGSFNQSAGFHQAGSLVVGQANGGTFTLSGTANLNVNGSETIGSGAAGSFTQSGGAHSAGSLTVGAAASGSYAMSGTASTLSVLGGVIVGDSGAGSFTQSAGSHTAAWLAIGNSPAGNGSYTLSGGSANFGDVGVGGNPYYSGGGAGSLLVNGTGAMKINGALVTYSGGTVTLAGGSLTANSIYTDPVSGPIRWTAGALNVTSTAPFTIGVGGPIGSAPTIDASKTLSVGGTIVVNPGATLGLSGGTVTAAALDLSAVGSSAFTWTTGTLNLTGTAGATVDPTGSLGGPFNLGNGQTLNIAGRLAVGATGAASFNQSGGQLSIGSLDLGTSAGASGTYSLGNGALNVATKAYIGDGGQGTLNLSGGTVTVNNGQNAVYLGYKPGGSGTLNVSGSGTLKASDVYVGFGGAGTVNQYGGNHLLTGFLVLGGEPDGTAGATGSGTYNLFGGQLNANTVYVGLSGTGAFTQSGGNSTLGQITAGYFQGASGTVTFSGTANVFEAGPEIYGDNGTGTFIQTGGSQLNAGITLGNGATGSGTATLSGGSISVSGVTLVGNNGRGTFNQSGGSHAPSNFYMGLAASGVGTYSMSNGATLHVTSDFSGSNQYNGNEYVGYYGNATFNQTGGTHTVDNYFSLAYAYGSSATYNLSGGSFGALVESIGYQSIANNTFNQTGGVNSARVYMTVGDQANGRATYNLSGNSTVSVADLYDAWAGQGTINQSGGTVTANQLFIAHEPSANAIYNLSGGTLIVTIGETIGFSGHGTFAQTGGTHAVASNATLTIGLNGASLGAYNLSGGLLAAGPVVNNASFNLSGGTATLGALSGGGTTTLTSASGAPTKLTVNSFAQSSLSIGNNTAVAVRPNGATSFTNSAGTLSITGSGQLDLANHRLVTTTPAATIRQYLVNAYANNAWTGSGGITSSTVASNDSGTVKKYTLGYAAAGEKNVVPTVPANSVLVRPTLFGDTNLDGKVDNADISAIIAGGKYLDGTTNNSWAVGDWNYDGKVDNNDVSTLIASGNYLSGETYNGTAPAASPAAAKLTSAAGIPAASTTGVSGDGVPDYVYDPATGDVKFRTDGQTGVQEVHLRSTSAQLQPQNMTDGGVGLNGLDVTTPGEIDLFRQGSSGGTLRQFADGYDFNNILPAGLSQAALLQDLTLSYTTNGGGTSNVPATLIYGSAATPEPTSLALLGVAAAGLLSRKRRR